MLIFKLFLNSNIFIYMHCLRSKNTPSFCYLLSFSTVKCSKWQYFMCLLIGPPLLILLLQPQHPIYLLYIFFCYEYLFYAYNYSDLFYDNFDLLCSIPVYILSYLILMRTDLATFKKKKENKKGFGRFWWRQRHSNAHAQHYTPGSHFFRLCTRQFSIIKSCIFCTVFVFFLYGYNDNLYATLILLKWKKNFKLEVNSIDNYSSAAHHL